MADSVIASGSSTGNTREAVDSADTASKDLIDCNLIGSSPAFTDALHLIRRVARSDATVLIQGETGTGKELAARAVHYLGRRRNFPFIPVNCGALPDSLVDNELFGHARGAYTDAREPSGGLIADAEGGTLFLDEVEALSMKAQVSLLRFLHDGTFRPLGGRQMLHAKVRIIAASNIDLGELVRAGAFRADFMYRLRLLAIEMPPLRERRGDIALVARNYIRKLSLQYRQEKRLEDVSVAALERHAWPGNVRELENVLHRAFLLSDGDTVLIDDYSFDATRAHLRRAPAAPTDGTEAATDFSTAKARAIGEFERAYLIRTLQRCFGNISAAARACGKERRAFGKLLRKYGIDKELYRGGAQ